MTLAAPLRVLLIPGSARSGSFNVKLATLAAELLRGKGAVADLFDLRALGLPLYDGDLEAESGVPPAAGQLAEAIAGHDAVIVVSPEYNAFPPPLLFNAFDWLSLLPAGRSAMAGKPTLLASASPGALGGMRSLLSLRQFLALNPGMLVLPQQFALPSAGTAFSADGTLADAKLQKALDGALSALLRVAESLRA